MNFYLLFIFIISIIGMNIFIKGFNKDYLNKDNTTRVNGIFILIVFFSHFKNYIEKINLESSKLMYYIVIHLDQLMVTTFLFFSGYGVHQSIIKKKKDYVKQMPKKRILIVWINLIIAVLTFMIFNLILGIHIDLKTNILAFSGWTSIGNSNWYIFVILFLYLFTYLSYYVFNMNDKKAIISVWIISIIFILFLNIYQEDYFFNTILCYPLGLSFSSHKKDIEKIVLKNNKNYFICLLTILVSFLIVRKYSLINVFYYELMAMFFVLLVVICMMKIKFNGKILNWFGKNLFWFYTLQRLPMIGFGRIEYFNNNPYIYFIACFVVSIILIMIYSRIGDFIKRLILRENKA